MAASLFVWVSVLFSAIGAFLFGYNVGSINGVQDMKGFRTTLGFDVPVWGEDASGLRDELMLNSTFPERLSRCSRAEDTSESSGFNELILGLLVAILNIGGLLGSLLAGKLADFAGRKVAIMIGGSLTVLAGILHCTAMNVWIVIVGRFIDGIGFGLLYMVIPVYIAEISPQRSRGKLSSTIGPMFAGGLLVGFVVNLGCVEFEIGWRISLGLQSVFGVMFVFGMSLLPRTPRWLLMTKKDDKAKQVITKIHSESKSDKQKKTVMFIFLELKESIQGAKQNYNWKSQLRDLLSWRISQRILMGVVISFLSPICGNFLMYYSVTLFCKLHIQPYISSVLMGTLNFGASLVTMLLVDKVGRKTLLLMGSLCMFLSLLASVILIFIFRVEEEGNLAVGYIVVVLLCFYLLSFSASWLTVPWIVNSEIFPICVRGVAVSLTSGALWLAAFIPVQLFPILLASPLRTPGTLSIIIAIVMFSFIYTFLFLPETKGIGLEDMEKLFARPWSQRMNFKASTLIPCQKYTDTPADQSKL